MPLTIYKWFQDQYVLIRSVFVNTVYDALSTNVQHLTPNRKVTIALFKHVLDNMEFRRYNNNNVVFKEEFIRAFLVT